MAISPIDVIEDWKLGYHLGTVVDLVLSSTEKARKKESFIADLRKARACLARLIEMHATYAEREAYLALQSGPLPRTASTCSVCGSDRITMYESGMIYCMQCRRYIGAKADIAHHAPEQDQAASPTKTLCLGCGSERIGRYKNGVTQCMTCGRVDTSGKPGIGAGVTIRGLARQAHNEGKELNIHLRPGKYTRAPAKVRKRGRSSGAERSPVKRSVGGSIPSGYAKKKRKKVRK